MERRTGIEPAMLSPQVGNLLIHLVLSSAKLEALLGIEPRVRGSKPRVLPLHHRAKIGGYEGIRTLIHYIDSVVLYQLSYVSLIWWGRWDSNPQNLNFKSSTYTNSITTPLIFYLLFESDNYNYYC
jgi:hypothetical protein